MSPMFSAACKCGEIAEGNAEGGVGVCPWFSLKSRNVANRTLICGTSFTETARKLQYELAKLGTLKQVNLTTA